MPPIQVPTNVSIEEQWDGLDLPAGLDAKWDNIEDAKRDVKIFLLNQNQSWGPSRDTNKKKMVLDCRCKDICDFHLRVTDLKKTRPLCSYCIPTSYLSS